uniref:protein FAM234A isoform X2 n=1 Tax=Myxine glutinosa TaxID=7769 RepID=UPI00358EED58
MATAFVGSLKISGKIPRHFGDYDPLGQVGSESSEEGVQEEEDEDNWRLEREGDGIVGKRTSSVWGNSFSQYPATALATADRSIDLSADMHVGDNKVELLTRRKDHMPLELNEGTACLQAPDSDTELPTPLERQPIGAKPLETWRMVAFVLSLILCILCTMSFAFLVPCPGRPSRRARWNISFPDASSTIALVSVRLQKNSTPGILVLYRTSSNYSSGGNDSCAFSGVPAPCSVLVALSLVDGLVLWKHSEPGIARALECSGGMQTSQNSSTICVMTRGDGTFIAFNPIDGHMIWVIRSTPDVLLINLVWPLLFLPDLNSDGIVEILLACAQAGPRKNTSLFYLFSGSNGKLIGQPVPHDFPIDEEAPTPVVHLHNGKDPYVIYSTGQKLLALSVSQMYKLALIQSAILSAVRTSVVSEKQHKPLGLSPRTLFRSRHGPFIQLTLIPGNGGGDNSSLLLMTSWQMTLLTGPSLTYSLWNISLGPVCPAFGRFGNDSLAGIMVQTLNGSGFSKVSLLDGASGQEVWTARTCGGKVPPPSVLPFRNDLFAFGFWSLGKPLESESTNCSRTGSPYSLWMLHADLPRTLSALANSSSRPILSNVLSEWGNDEPTLVSISRAEHLSSGLLLQSWPLQSDLPKEVALMVPSKFQNL